MLVERIWTGNAYRNFNYLIACPETGEALAIDPLDHGKCLQAAKVRGWQITQVLNTHEHHDHTGGNDAVIEATGAKLLAHHKSGSKIRGVDRGLQAGDIVKVKVVEVDLARKRIALTMRLSDEVIRKPASDGAPRGNAPRGKPQAASRTASTPPANSAFAAAFAKAKGR